MCACTFHLVYCTDNMKIFWYYRLVSVSIRLYYYTTTNTSTCLTSLPSTQELVSQINTNTPLLLPRIMNTSKLWDLEEWSWKANTVSGSIKTQASFCKLLCCVRIILVINWWSAKHYSHFTVYIHCSSINFVNTSRISEGLQPLFTGNKTTNRHVFTETKVNWTQEAFNSWHPWQLRPRLNDVFFMKCLQIQLIVDIQAINVTVIS